MVVRSVVVGWNENKKKKDEDEGERDGVKFVSLYNVLCPGVVEKKNEKWHTRGLKMVEEAWCLEQANGGVRIVPFDCSLYPYSE